MPIKVLLDDVLKKNGITSKELCELVDITEANMSILRSGKAKAIRFETLEKLCFYLKCAPGDLLNYVKGDEDNENV